MANNWTETIRRRRAGLDPAHHGAGETRDAYQQRTNPAPNEAPAKKAPAKKRSS